MLHRCLASYWSIEKSDKRFVYTAIQRNSFFESQRVQPAACFGTQKLPSTVVQFDFPRIAQELVDRRASDANHRLLIVCDSLGNLVKGDANATEPENALLD